MTRFNRAFAFALAFATAAGFQSAASAQSVRSDLANGATSNFARDRNISVRQRPHPEYQAPAHRLGAFTVSPTVNVTGEYNDNIYAVANGKENDFVAHIQPRIDIASTWSRHALTAYAQGTLNRYADFTTEDSDTYQFGGTGQLDIVRGSYISVGADHGRLVEPRTSTSTQISSLKPIRYYQSDAYIAGVREMNRLRLSARADWRKFNYLDGRTALGTPVEQDDRDRTTTSLLGRADYAVSPDTALFVEVSGNWRDYREKPPVVSLTRDSDGYEILGGANFELTNLIRGEIGVGYLSQRFDDPSFRDLNGFGARGEIEWFPTQLTTVTLTGARTIEDSGLRGSSGYLSTNTGLQIDHELMRNLILTGNAGYGHDKYQGLDRKDNRVTLGLSATYLMNRRISWNLAYSHFNQTSDGAAAGFDFKVNRILLTLTGRL